jgi:hypothetical protein
MGLELMGFVLHTTTTENGKLDNHIALYMSWANGFGVNGVCTSHDNNGKWKIRQPYSFVHELG